MQVFKTFFKIAYKRIGSIIIYFILFTVLALLFANTSSSDTGAFESTKIDISIIDEDKSTASKALTDYLDKNHNLVEIENEKDIILDNIYYRTVDYVLTIPKGFEEKILNNDTEDILSNVAVPGGFAGKYAEQQINEYIKTISMYTAGGFSIDDAIEATNDTFDGLEEVKNISFVEKSGTEDTGLFLFYQYIPYVLVLILLNGLAPIIIRFNDKEINNRIRCSALTFKSQNAQLLLSALVYGVFSWLVFAVIAFIRYGNTLFTTNGLLCLLNSFVFMTVSFAITMLITNFSPGSNALSMLSNILGLTLGFMGGIFVPLWIMDEKVLVFSKFLPTYWYTKGNNMLGNFAGEAYDINTFLGYVGIELIFTVTLVILSIVAAKTVKDKATA